MNAQGWNVYVGVNAYRPGRSRTREAVAAVRHLFLEEDVDGPGLLAALSTRRDLPPPSYVLHSSPGRLHVLWRVHDIAPSTIERLQKQLARELSHRPGRHIVCADHAIAGTVQSQAAAWRSGLTSNTSTAARCSRPSICPTSVLMREERSAAAHRGDSCAGREPRRSGTRLPPACRSRGSGQQGDLRTFRVCCRIVRGSTSRTTRPCARWPTGTLDASRRGRSGS